MSRLNRRLALASLFGACCVLAAPTMLRAQARAQSPATRVEVWKSPSCGCCQDWITHLEAHGFSVKVHDVGNAAARARLKVPEQLGSCHTAWVGGYAIEGHVPATDIRRLLKERPDAIGLTVPGMPIGSPGMDGPEYGQRRDPYDVLLIGQDGRTQVFSSYFKPKGR
ncbi:MAG: DUF411 domain-containing protein [Ideonella sp.]|nr:DUF411 domain-containing protein [Ideonella sp.]